MRLDASTERRLVVALFAASLALHVVAAVRAVGMSATALLFVEGAEAVVVGRTPEAG